MMDLAFLINELWRQRALLMAQRPRPRPTVVVPLTPIPPIVAKPEARS